MHGRRDEVALVKPAEPLLPKNARGGRRLEGAPERCKIGRLSLRRGHQGLSPAGCAYRLSAEAPSVFTIQTILGPSSVEKRAEICLT